MRYDIRTFEINKFLQDKMMSNSFWKIMTKFNFMCDNLSNFKRGSGLP